LRGDACKRTIDLLIAVLEDPVAGSDPSTCAAVAIALSNLGGDVAFTPILPLLKDKDDYVREVTEEALAAETQVLPC